MKLLLSLILAQLMTASLAQADIRGSQSKVYIEVKVTPHAKNNELDTVQFRVCNKHTQKCKLLGYKRDYTIQELHDQRYQEQ